MASALKKQKIERDRFTEDGVRLFNASKEHGVIYCDGFLEAKYVQEFEGEVMMYRGDGAPVGYTKGVPMPRKADELLSENEALQARIRDLEDSQKRTNELLAKLSLQLEAKDPPKPVPAVPKATEAPARGAAQPK
jgi:hypothetical protein